MDRLGKLRTSVKNRIDRMTVEIAIDLLLTRSNRASSINRRIEFMTSYIGDDVRWNEMDYADMIAQAKVGYAPQIEPIDIEDSDDEWDFIPVAYRHTRRYYYLTTDDDGNEIEKEPYL